ncbi:MAG TPA: hypothetical protein PK569_20040 [Thermoanaerobaculia bacterium]|jgi:hypothetical protein|nr:hypothetical protein [Thermoanaerobaculia bacterium]
MHLLDAVFSSSLAALPEIGKESLRHLRATPELARKAELVWRVGHDITSEAPPADLESVLRGRYFPFAEATTDLEYSILFALTGVHKAAYSSLRSYFELSLVGTYFLAHPDADRKAREWLQGRSNTPFKRDLFGIILAQPVFVAAEPALNLKARLDATYGRLSDFAHTRGAAFGHLALTKSNRPRFQPEALQAFIDDALEAGRVTALALILQRPILTLSMPLFEKFGLNVPLSGFLDGEQVATLRSILSEADFEWAERWALNDPDTVQLAQYIEALPDITEAEWAEQKRRFDESLQQLAPKVPDSSDPAAGV